MFGYAALSETTFLDQFHRFKGWDFDVENSLLEGRIKTFEGAKLETFFDEGPCQTQEEHQELEKLDWG